MTTVEKIKVLCDEHGETFASLERKMDFGNGTIRRWSNTLPSADKLAKVAKFFGVSTDYLLGKISVKNPNELLEFWGAGSDPFFEHAFDFGAILKEEREKKGISLEEMSEALGTTELELEECEEGLLPLNYDWAERMANYLGTNVSQLLFEHDLYDGAVPEDYHHDVRHWEKLTNAAEEEAMSEISSNKKNAANVGDGRASIPSNLTPYLPTGKVAIYGQIPAGIAQLAVEEIEGYTYVDVPDPENHFALRVKGDSMVNAGIYPGDLVIIRYQQCADNGQIVACRINGDESTLKRFKQHGDTVVLMPENSKYEPIIVSCKEFEIGYASIIGVAVEVKRSLL